MVALPHTGHAGVDARMVDRAMAGQPRREPVAPVRSKLYVPAIPRRALMRRRLIDALADDRRVALVVAPAGYGKSTLLAQWTAESDRPVAWVTLDRDDSDPVRFWMHVVCALSDAVPHAFELKSNALAYASTPDLVDGIANKLCAVEDGVVLVLDDYHEVRSGEVDDSLDRLVSRLPFGVMIAISTRRDPDMALTRWRAAEQMVEVRQDDLRFTPEEAKEWFESQAIDATSDAVAESLSVTEGWPAAYTLAFGSGRRNSERLDVRGRHVMEYIREEVMRDHEEDWPVLVVCALCPEVSAPLLEYTLEIPDGRQALRRLVRSDVLLERRDVAGEWFRLHGLIADYILMGHRSDPNVRRWMVRVAEWHIANDRHRTALDTLIQAGEHELACDMINQSWLQMVHTGQLATLRRDLSRIEPETAAQSVSYLVTQAWLRAYEGRRRDALLSLQRAEDLGRQEPLPDGSPSSAAARALLNCFHAVEGLATVTESARQADELIDESSAWRPIADLAIGYALFVAGRLDDALPAFDRAQASSDAVIRLLALGWSTVVDVLQGEIDAARARFVDAVEWCNGDPFAARLPAFVVARSAIAIAEGRPIEAAADLEESRTRLGLADPTDRLELLIWLADAEVRVGRTSIAKQWIEAARQIVARFGGSDWHEQRLHEIEERLAPSSELNGRDPGLTDRETRILQLLAATHLSQREIGRELGISFNTIKSHVKAIYVKLGATSREEAAQIARNLALI